MTGRYGTQDAEYRADVLRYNGVGAALRTIISDVEHGIDRITHHQTTAAQATAAPTPTEDRMSLATFITDAEEHIKAGLAKFGEVDHEALTAIDALDAHPETGTLLHDVGALIGINLPPGILTAALAPVKALLQAYGPQIEAQQAQQAAEAQQQAAQ